MCYRDDEDSLALYAIQKEAEKARHYDAPKTPTHTTPTVWKSDEPKRGPLNEIYEIDSEFLCFALEVSEQRR